ncbi:TonB-dependent receptor [Pseudoxanthomonas dokdonensis]|uniref:TonB-dependent receptor n=1 Tax=Pseudoxanthomonas dokdonensis TaxID=344882 RepID=A0A0R0CV86_9GAMM|nr:TonB-dependent receptor [Pseudoxanthomonas dokdonensis]
MVIPAAGAAFAQDADTASNDQARATNLDKVTVTGSLIPQTEVETFTPVMTITAEDIQARGFTSVADVLKQSAMSTGGVQGAQSSASFTQGAETIGLFGLDPGYTKYLIDGRPMGNYPALYNGSSTFNNISNIPVDLVERIEILPGGQSSLYGSDAIAGVINIILKKSMDGAALNIRGGWYSDGGGSSVRVGLADGFSAADGRLNGLVGVQYEERDPIWGYQRDLTKQYNTRGTSAPIASRDYLVFGYKNIGTLGFDDYGYVDLPAAAENCANVTGQFGGTEGPQNRPGFGTYCGSFYTPGYRTLQNGKEAGQFMGHVTFDFSDNVQGYADLLYSHEEVESHVGSNYTWWGTGTKWGYYYDPAVDGLINLQRAFAPEDMGVGGYRNSMSKDKSDAYQAALGVKGFFGSDWDYDVGVNYTRYELDEGSFVRWADPINDYFEQNVLGPQQGWDPYYGAYPVFTPNYAAFYQPISPQDFNSFTGYAHSKSQTSDGMLRAQVTNSSLFSLPGGDAGLAIAAEWGKQKWDYTPDPGFLDGSIWGQTAVAGGGERDRYAVTTELRLPIVDMLTVTASGRYDAFKPDGGDTIDKPTYSLGLEFRPIDSLLLRGKYGTAFRAPTLSDQFQGLSGSYVRVTDYYGCAEAGYSPEDPVAIDKCPASLSNRQIFSTTSGNVDLEPINADVWNAGFVWAPTAALSFNADYYNWDISNEVRRQSVDGILFQEYRCREGLDDITSPTCVQAFSQITRNAASGNVEDVYAPKVNVANQTLEAVTAGFNYAVSAGAFGDLSFNGNYTQILNHDVVELPGDPSNDYLNDPYYSTDPEKRGNLSATWTKNRWSSTVYANWIGETPNYAASISSRGYDATNGGKLDSWTTYNASVTYQAFEGLDLSFLVNNLTNEMPPFDDSYPGSSGAPYNEYNYNVYGRSMYIELRYAFGAGK